MVKKLYFTLCVVELSLRGVKFPNYRCTPVANGIMCYVTWK